MIVFVHFKRINSCKGENAGFFYKGEIINMSIYSNTPAIGQIDPTLCWAACLSWWMKAVKRIEVKQTTLRDRHYKMWDDDGTLSDQAMMKLIRNKRYGMTFDSFINATTFTAESLQEHLDYSPVYVAYTETSSQTKHVNVIYGLTGTGGSAQVSVMEPQDSPILDDTGFDSGEYNGKHTTKPLSEFNTFGSVYVGSLMLSI